MSKSVTYWMGPDLPYEPEPKEYITVNNCDISRRSLRNKSDVYITLRENGRPDYYILYVISGRILAEINGSDIEAQLGDVIVYYPNEKQKLTYYREDKTENFWIHFTGYAVPEILSQCGFSKSGVYRGEVSRLAEEIFTQIMLAQKLNNEKIHVNSLFLQLMDALSGSRKEIIPDSASSRVLRAVMQLSWERRAPKKIPYYAAMCGMSTARFAVVFKEATGRTPTEFLEDARMEDAKKLLDKTTLTVSEVSASVGYRDPLYFSRIFRRRFGVPPTEYRKRVRADKER